MGTETPKERSSKYQTMKIIGLALFVAFIAFVLAHQLQIPFLNSSGWTVNEIHYSTRLYWMQQANEALYKYSGPWFSGSKSVLIAVLSEPLELLL